MKRFWREAAPAAVGPPYAIQLDGRPCRTPRRRPLALPSRPLADAVAAEWAEAGETVDPRAMPLTGLANAAIDIVADDPAASAADCAAYAASDLLCHRADGPASLTTLQDERWEPALRWAEGHFGIRFARAVGVMPLAQPAPTLAAIRAAFANEGPFALAGLLSLVRLTGSAVLPLALRHGVLAPQRAWEAAILDEAWQAARFGHDHEAAERRAERERAFHAAIAFLALATGDKGPASP